MADPVDLDALERLLAAATPGESEVRTPNDVWVGVILIAHYYGDACPGLRPGEGLANAKAGSALRNAAPSLLAEVRRLRAVEEMAKRMPPRHTEHPPRLEPTCFACNLGFVLTGLRQRGGGA